MKRKLLLLICATLLTHVACALEREPLADYRARRVALAEKLRGGAALLFAAGEPQLDFLPYRQDEDFYYLSGWNEPGAAMLLIPAVPASDGISDASDVASARPRAAQPYREILFLPTRNLRIEQFTGAKLDAVSPAVTSTTGFAEVLPYADLPGVLNQLASADRSRLQSVWAEPGSPQALAVMGVAALSLGMAETPAAKDVSQMTMMLRATKSPAEIELLRKAADASIAAQRAGMKAIKPGLPERAIAGTILAKLMAEGCERQAYAPIVGSGPNATTLHYSANAATMKEGGLVVIDAAGEYSMYASDITRTMPVSGHFTARQKEIYEIVLGAQRAAAAAFVAGKSKINDPRHSEPDSLDQAAFDYINAHGSDLHGQPLGQYMVHGLGHLVGIDVHDPWDYAKPLDRGMVFTIEPGLYLPEENIGVRIEDVYYVDPNGKLVDLIANLPHEAADIEAAMQH